MQKMTRSHSLPVLITEADIIKSVKAVPIECMAYTIKGAAILEVLKAVQQDTETFEQASLN
jgi:hypothetical protein